MQVHIVAQSYGLRPSQLIDKSGILDEVTAFCIDEALAIRARVEESEAYRRAREEGEAEAAAEAADVESAGAYYDPDEPTPRQRAKAAKEGAKKSGNHMHMRGGKLDGAVDAPIGKMSPKDLQEYEKAGGRTLKRGEKDPAVERLIAERRARMQEALMQRTEQEQQERAARVEAQYRAKHGHGPVDGQP